MKMQVSVTEWNLSLVEIKIEIWTLFRSWLIEIETDSGSGTKRPLVAESDQLELQWFQVKRRISWSQQIEMALWLCLFLLMFVAILDYEGLELGIAGLPSGQATSVLPSKPAKGSPVLSIGVFEHIWKGCFVLPRLSCHEPKHTNIYREFIFTLLEEREWIRMDTLFSC